MSTEIEPVSRLAAERALSRVIGGKSTDVNKYRKFQQLVTKRYPEYWGVLPVMADMHERSSRISAPDLNIQATAYVGGSLIYLAAREEQAKLDKDQSPLAIARPGLASFGVQHILTTGLTVQAAQDVVVGMGREMSNEDAAQLGQRPVSDILNVQKELFEKYGESFVNSPFISEFGESITQAASMVLAGAMVRVAQFPAQEEGFCTAMTTHWWNDIEPAAAVAQALGAADLRFMFELAADYPPTNPV